MSALAARKAAQAAMATSAPAESAQSAAPVDATPARSTRSRANSNANGKAATPTSNGMSTRSKTTPKATPKGAAKETSKGTPKDTPKTTPKATPPPPRSPSPAFDSEASLDLSSDEEDAGPSQKRRKVSRAKVRYFPADDEPVKKEAATGAGKRRKERAFSPSAPQFDVSSDDGSSGEEEEEAIEAEEDFQDGPTGMQTPWSAASPREAGPSRSVSTLRAGTSRFDPRDGVNVLRVEEATLAAAGLKAAGPGVVVSLSKHDELLIAGAYTITPLRQSLRLLSTTIHPSYEGEETEAYPVFAPTSHPIPGLKAAGDDDLMLESPIFSRLKLPKTLDKGAGQSIVLIQENRCGIEGLRGDVVPGFNNIWVDDGSATGLWGLRGVHPVLVNFATPVYPHCTAPSWHTALESLAQSDYTDDISDASPQPQDRVPVVLVKGPKRSGKSSLARAALNRLLGQYERVAWLECDLGQGEFGCGGVVGLWVIDSPVLGPAFTHPRLPVRAHFLGELSPQSCPDEYMAAIHQLISHYQYEVQYPLTHTGGRRRNDAVPLVVNTQGWVKGLGEDLMRAIEGAVEPTHVFAFESSAEEGLPTHAGAGWTNSPVHQAADLPFAAPWEAQPQSNRTPAAVFALEPAPSSPLQARYTAADMRALSTIAYMHARLGSTVTWDFSAPLLAVAPWTVSLGPGQVLSRAYLLGESADAVDPADLPLALNGSLVALLEAPEESEDGEVYVPATAPPLDDSSFLGLALVRAARPDEQKLQLQVVTPLPAAVLARARAIVRNGALELPTPALLDFRDRAPGGGVPEDGLAGVRWDDVPFFDAAESRAVGGERRRFRRNLQRKGV